MPRDGGDHLALCVFIDALGWQLQRRHGFLEDLLPRRAPLDTVLGYSSTCDPTILTGRMPREHGHFSFYRYDPVHSPFRGWRCLGLLPDWLTRRGRVRSALSRLGGRWLGFTGYFQLYNVPFGVLSLLDYTERRDIYQAGGINAGVPTIFDDLRARGVPFHLSDWRRPETENLARLTAAVDRGRVRFAYLYLAAMDGLLHARGTSHPEVAAKIGWYADRVRQLVDRARRRYRQVVVHVFSDHGMTDVRSVSDLMVQVDGLGARYGRDFAAIYDSTMARFWYFDESARRDITDLLARRGDGRILTRCQLAAYGCDFADGRYGEQLFLADPGVLICPSFMADRPLAAMHGYAPEHPDSVAFYGSSDPEAVAPARLDGLYDVMRGAAGLGAG